MVMESSEDYVVNELDKTKKKLKEITTALETQQQFLRLIVQVSRYMYHFTYYGFYSFNCDLYKRKLSSFLCFIKF